jgi:uncharacterized metal-binding protein YceD (DUF177 family)
VPVEIGMDPLEFGGEHYEPVDPVVEGILDVTRTVGGWSLRLQFTGSVEGRCVRCLGPATVTLDVDAREVEQPGGGEDLQSPYVEGSDLELRTWAREAFVLEFPVHVVCQEDCRGICAGCGQNLNDLPPDHGHEGPGDSRWSKLSELKFD